MDGARLVGVIWPWSWHSRCNRKVVVQLGCGMCTSRVRFCLCFFLLKKSTLLSSFFLSSSSSSSS